MGTSKGDTHANGAFGSSDALAFILKEWDQLWDTKASLEQRAITLITTSGVLVTLAFGFAAVVAKGKNFGNFDRAEKVALSVSLFLFACSALIALYTNVPKSWSVPDFSDLLGISKGTPPMGIDIKPREAAAKPGLTGGPNTESTTETITPLTRLANAIATNTQLVDKKARLLTGAFLVQILAIAILAIDVGVVVG